MHDLSFEGVRTGVLFGVFRDIGDFFDLHQPKSAIFCFDRGRPIRKDVDARYKANREVERDEDVLKARAEVAKQAKALANEYLPAMGFRNICHQQGYEADDMIAKWVIDRLPKGDRAVIASDDADLHQLLTDRVSCWAVRKKHMITAQMFRDKWGISPTQWADVKALAGCKSDNVVGVHGVGEKKAIQYLTGVMNPQSATYEKIIKGSSEWKKNLRLVQLPFEGTKVRPIREDEVTRKRWQAVCKSLGMESLKRSCPV